MDMINAGEDEPVPLGIYKKKKGLLLAGFTSLSYFFLGFVHKLFV